MLFALFLHSNVNILLGCQTSQSHDLYCLLMGLGKNWSPQSPCMDIHVIHKKMYNMLQHLVYSLI